MSPGLVGLTSSGSFGHLVPGHPRAQQWARTTEVSPGPKLGISLSGGSVLGVHSATQKDAAAVSATLKSPRCSRTSLTSRSDATPTGKLREVKPRANVLCGPPPTTGVPSLTALNSVAVSRDTNAAPLSARMARAAQLA